MTSMQPKLPFLSKDQSVVLRNIVNKQITSIKSLDQETTTISRVFGKDEFELFSIKIANGMVAIFGFDVLFVSIDILHTLLLGKDFIDYNRFHIVTSVGMLACVGFSVYRQRMVRTSSSKSEFLSHCFSIERKRRSQTNWRPVMDCYAPL